MRLVDYHDIPWRVCNIGGFVARELIRTNDDAFGFERAKVASLNGGVIRLRLENAARRKTSGYLLMPLFRKFDGTMMRILACAPPFLRRTNPAWMVLPSTHGPSAPFDSGERRQRHRLGADSDPLAHWRPLGELLHAV